jgi:hypothetical protein
MDRFGPCKGSLHFSLFTFPPLSLALASDFFARSVRQILRTNNRHLPRKAPGPDEIMLRSSRQYMLKMAVFWVVAPWSGRSLPSFQRSLLPPSSGRWVLIYLRKVRKINAVSCRVFAPTPAAYVTSENIEQLYMKFGIIRCVSWFPSQAGKVH